MALSQTRGGLGWGLGRVTLSWTVAILAFVAFLTVTRKDVAGTTRDARQAVGLALPGPAGARGGADPQRPELVEGEDAGREAFQHLLDPVGSGRDPPTPLQTPEGSV